MKTPHVESKYIGFIQRLKPVGEVLSLGLAMGICLAIGIGIGIYIDSRWGTTPWGAGLGIFWGLAAAVTRAWRVLSQCSKVIIDESNRPK